MLNGEGETLLVAFSSILSPFLFIIETEVIVSLFPSFDISIFWGEVIDCTFLSTIFFCWLFKEGFIVCLVGEFFELLITFCSNLLTKIL